ncbi:MAG: glycosyltransferase family 2 protein, partial [Burkholderiales bacterium]|nr:glycosyltransferase family 2 protein [Opitutaceae bacterium]
MSSHPSVALLVPCHNAARYLPRLAGSVRAQTVPFAEIICYDDGSTDDTAAVARSLGWRILTPNTNRGPSRARNALAAAASSAWIHFHDADDLLHPSYLAEASAAADHDCDVVVCDSSWELEHSRELVIHWTYRAADHAADPLAYPVTHPVGVISALVRREAFVRSGGFDESATCWEDADLFVRLAEIGARFRFLERTLVTSLRHDRGISRDQDHCTRCRLHFLEGYAARLPARLAPVIGGECEKLLPAFLAAGDLTSARAALSLCRRLGLRPPTTLGLGKLDRLDHRGNAVR